MNPPQLPWIARISILFALLAVPSAIALGQETAARPDRGLMPNGSYAVSDIENISLANGNMSLRVPLASLPPVAGGKLSWTINAHYNSKIWNVTREELHGERYDLSLPPVNYVVDTPQLSEQGGWRISGQYEINFRNARLDFDYQTPAVGDEPDRSLMLNYNWYRVVLRMPDGAEHELRPMDYSSFSGTKSFLYGYYNAIPDTHGTMRYYSFDGSYLYAVITSETNWTVYLPDGTKVIHTPDGIQRIQDTNGNKIKIFSDANGTHYQDEQTGREIRHVYVAGEDDEGWQERIYYKTVDGVDQYIALNWGKTTVQGQVFKLKGWIPGQFSTQPCNYNGEINTDIPVIKEIVLPESESNVTRKITFGYSSDTTETASSINVRFSCSAQPDTYVRTASKGWGFLNHIEMPSGAKIDYMFGLDTGHMAIDTDDLAGVNITQKKLEHDQTIDTWTYSILEHVSTVTNPDNSTITELKRPRALYMGSAFGKGGLSYRTTQPFSKTERHWTHLVFSDANLSSPGGIDFNSMVDFEYTTLTDSAGNNLKMSAKGFQHDYNGNVVQTTEYDWFDPASVQRDTDGVPTGVPAGATVLRTTNSSFYNPATASTSANVYAKRSISGATPLILNALKESTTGAAVVQLSYDGNSYGAAPTAGNLTSKSVWDDVDTKWITSSSTYGLYGNLATVTDGRGKVTQFFYDDSTHALPNRVVVDPQNGTGTQTTTTVFDYSTGLVTSSTDPNGNTATIDYANPLISNQKDPFGRPGMVSAPALDVNGVSHQHRTRTFYYDSARMVRVQSDLNVPFDGLMKAETFSDMLGRPIESRQYENANDFIAVRKSYDIQNRISKTSNPFRAGETIVWTTTLSDAAGRMVSVTTPDNAVVSTSYDADQTLVTDQAGKQRKSVTNALGQLTSVFEDPSGLNYQTSYNYDVVGNLLHVYQGSQTRTFTYDSLSRLRTAENPESGIVSYTYDDNGNLTQKIDPRLVPNTQNHITTTYVYDSLNRATSRTYNDGTPAVSYSYDSTSIANGKGRLASVSNSVSTYSYSGYDAMGRVQGASQTVGSQTYTMTHEHDLAGHVIKLSYPSGRIVENAFDDAGRLQTFSGKLGDGATRTYANEFKYTAWNSLQQERFGTDATLYHKQRFNVRGQLWDVRASTVSYASDPANGDRGSIVNYYSSSFTQGASGTDNNGNLLRQESYVPGSSFYQDNFGYDALNRLTAISEKLNGTGNDTFKQSYAFDRWGNRLIDTAPSKTWGNGINIQSLEVNTSNNRLTVPAGQSGVMAYDAAGNLTTDTYTGDGTRTYDAENRMISSAGSLPASYSYDGDGRRIKRNVNGAETWQVYGLGGELLAEYAANTAGANPEKEYGYRNGALLITTSPGAPAASVNVASASNGATASASSTLGAQTAAHAINGDRKGLSYTWWTDDTSNGYPDWIQIDFSGAKNINEIDVFGLQQNYTNPVDPTLTMTSGYALTNFEVQYWNGSAWAAIPGASVTASDKVWKKLTFAALTTSKIKINVTNVSGDNHTQVVEVEAYGVPAVPTNVASTANGATASASSTLGTQNAAHVINGDRKGLSYNWWTDDTSNGYPDWIQVDFSGSKTINEIDVFGLQQNYSSPVEPTLTMTSSYALTNFEVQYWTGSAWTTIPGGSVSGNDKVWRKFTFASVTTSKIRVNVANVAGDNHTQVVEVEAYEGTGSGAEIKWLVSDQLGTPRMIFDQTGSLATVSRHDYLPFGEEIFAGTGGRTVAQGFGGDNTRQKFTSKERDVETGLDYFGARYYASILGRFTGVDPIMVKPLAFNDPQRWNLYGHARQNPLKYIDPDGRDLVPVDELSAAQLKVDLDKVMNEAEAKNVTVKAGENVSLIDANAIDPRTASPAYRYLLQVIAPGVVRNYQATTEATVIAYDGSSVDVGAGQTVFHPPDDSGKVTAMDIYVPTTGAPQVWNSNNTKPIDEPREMVTAHEALGHGTCGRGQCAVAIENEIRKDRGVELRSGSDHESLPGQPGNTMAAPARVTVSAPAREQLPVPAYTPPATQPVMRTVKKPNE